MDYMKPCRTVIYSPNYKCKAAHLISMHISERVNMCLLQPRKQNVHQ